MSPFKTISGSANKREFGTVQKSSGQPRGAFDADLNDRADFDRSIKVVGSSTSKKNLASPDIAAKKN